MALAYNPKVITDGLVLCLDAASSNCYSPNAHPAPLNIHSWVNAATGNNCNLSPDPSVTDSPARGIPMKMVTTGADAHAGTYNAAKWNIAPAANGEVWTVSVYVRSNVASTTAQLFMMVADSAGAYLTSTNTTTAIGTTWTRVSCTYTITSANAAYAQVRLDGPDTYTAGTILWWDGIQVEKQSSPTPFNPNTNTNNSSFKDLSTINSSVTDIGGTRWSYGPKGACGFDFTNDYDSGINIANNNFTLASHTMEAVVKVTGNHSNYTGSFISSGDWNNTHWAWGMNQANTAIQTRNPTTSWSYSPTLNSWFHVVWKKTGTVSEMFVNGTSLGTTTVAGFPNIISGFTNTMVGRETYAGGYFNLEGQIGLIRVYNRALTTAQIQQNFNAIRGRYSL